MIIDKFGKKASKLSIVYTPWIGEISEHELYCNLTNCFYSHP